IAIDYCLRLAQCHRDGTIAWHRGGAAVAPWWHRSDTAVAPMTAGFQDNRPVGRHAWWTCVRVESAKSARGRSDNGLSKCFQRTDEYSGLRGVTSICIDTRPTTPGMLRFIA